MRLKRETCVFHRLDEMERFCRRLEAEGYRSSGLASVVLHRSYSIQHWVDVDRASRWRVEWHAHGNNER